MVATRSSRSSATSGAASSPRLIGFLGDFDLAEEAAQEAFAIAAERWPRDGTPDNPRAWLVTTARNRAIDRIRRDRTLAGEDPPARRAGGDGGRDGRDDDPGRAARAALHLLPSGARARRPGRAHAADAGRADARRRSPAPSSSPSRRWPSGSSARSARSRPPGSRSACRPPHLLPDRLAAVLAVVYLIFNEGYGGRGDLAAEAIRLGPRARRADARRARGARAAGADAGERRAARGALRRRRRSSSCATRTARSGTSTRSRRGGRRSTARWRSAAAVPTSLQAAIASLHSTTRRDWPQIAALYGELARLTGSPVVELNRAAAIAEAGERRGRARAGREPRARPLPLPARDARGAAAPARPGRGRARGLRPRARARPLRRRAALPRAAAPAAASGHHPVGGRRAGLISARRAL